jgi:hypothetical protein
MEQISMPVANRRAIRGLMNGVLTCRVLCAAAFFACLAALGQDNRDAPVRPTPEIYAAHLQRVLQLLPPHSGPPPLLDLSKLDEGVPGAGKKWEDRFTGNMGIRPIDDPGVHSLDEATSILTNTVEYAGRPPLLPAKNCPIVAVARPLKASAHLAYNNRFVYSSFEVELLQVLKGSNKRNVTPGAHIIAAQLGGSIRFLSGHEVACLEANEGFLELGKQYLLFLWEPVKPSNTYMTDEAYLFENGYVFPVAVRFGEKRYSGVGIEAFLKKVKGAIGRDIDTD